MLIENSFTVPASIDVVWTYLLDVEKVVVCMPGAQLTEAIDDSSWKGKVGIKLGPVSLSFSGKVSLVERDDDAHRVVLSGSGMEQRGKGRAAATVTTTAKAVEDGTRVEVVQDLQVQGQVASMSRGMMQDVSSKLTKQFAECLARSIVATPGDRGSEGGGAARPIPSEAPASPSRPDVAPTGSPARAADAPASRDASEGGAAPAGAKLNGLSLLAGALWSSLRRALARLFTRLLKR